MMLESRKTPLQGARAGIDHSVIPMINVVFLILMFFLVAGKFQGIDAAGIDIPLSSSVEPITGNNEVITLTDGGVIIWRDKQLKIEVLMALASSKEIAFPARVIVLTDAATRAAAVLELIEGLKDHGVHTISLVTVEK